MGRLRDDRHKARVNDPLVRRDEFKPQHARCTYNRPVGGIAKGSAECGDLGSNFHCEGYYLKRGIGIELVEKLIERGIASCPAFAKQNRDLEERDCADRDGLILANGIPQNAGLFPRKLFGRCKPANGYMCVEEQAGIQRRAPLR
jgi:hypothetical protein